MLANSKDRGMFIKIFMIYILINPFIDLLSGVFLDIFKIETSITPGIVIRMAFLVLMGIYILVERDSVNIKYILLMGITWILTVAGEIIFNTNKSLFTEIQYFARFAYNLIIIFVYERVLYRLKDKDINWRENYFNSIVLAGMVFAVVIVISFITSSGFGTYDGNVGTKGYFHSGNDVTAVLSIILPISMLELLQKDKKYNNWKKAFLRYFAPIIISMALILIATRVAYLTVIFCFITFGIFIFFRCGKLQKKKFIILAAIVISTTALLFVTPKGGESISKSVERQKTNIESRDDEVLTYILSSRNYKAKEAIKQYMEGNFYTKLFGIGRGSQVYTIEMDMLEVFFYYGIIGFTILMYPYIMRGLAFLFYMFKNFDMENFALFLSIGIGAGTAFLAGHVLFSATSGIYLSLIVAFAYLKVLNHKNKLAF